MKITPAPLQHPFWKIVGLVLFTVGCGSIIFFELNTDIAISKNISAITYCGVLGGLFFIAFSQECKETDLIKELRYSSYRIAFLCTGMYFLIFTLDDILTPGRTPSPIFGAIIFFGSYLLPFYTGLAFKYEFKAERSAESQMRKYPLYYLAYFAVVSLIFIGFLLFF